MASADDTGTGQPFSFDRLGVRVPAILISPWIKKSTVVPGPEDAANGKIYEHASIPATVTKYFIGDLDARSPREKNARSFLDDMLGDVARPPEDCPFFQLD